jgi:hypothetical protein
VSWSDQRHWDQSRYVLKVHFTACFKNITCCEQDFKESFADPIKIGMMTDATQMQAIYFKYVNIAT